MNEREADGQERVVTIWRDGTYTEWGAMDAEYAKSDPQYLRTISMRDVLPILAKQIALIDLLPKPYQEDWQKAYTKTVYSLPDCPFQYCDNPPDCQSMSHCRYRGGA